MASTTINPDGTITVALSAQELALSQMILAADGADVFTNVFNVWFNMRVKDVLLANYQGLSAVQQTAVLSTLAPVAPVAAVAAVKVGP